MTMYKNEEQLAAEIEGMSNEELIHGAALLIAASRNARQNGVGYHDKATSFATEAIAVSNLVIGRTPENVGFANQDQQALRDMLITQKPPTEAPPLTPEAAPYPRGEGDGWS